MMMLARLGKACKMSRTECGNSQKLAMVVKEGGQFFVMPSLVDLTEGLFLGDGLKYKL